MKCYSVFNETIFFCLFLDQQSVPLFRIVKILIGLILLTKPVTVYCKLVTIGWFICVWVGTHGLFHFHCRFFQSSVYTRTSEYLDRTPCAIIHSSKTGDYSQVSNKSTRGLTHFEFFAPRWWHFFHPDRLSISKILSHPARLFHSCSLITSSRFSTLFA